MTTIREEFLSFIDWKRGDISIEGYCPRLRSRVEPIQYLLSRAQRAFWDNTLPTGECVLVRLKTEMINIDDPDSDPFSSIIGYTAEYLFVLNTLLHRDSRILGSSLPPMPYVSICTSNFYPVTLDLVLKLNNMSGSSSDKVMLLLKYLEESEVGPVEDIQEWVDGQVPQLDTP